jgi:hypothetical protein
VIRSGAHSNPDLRARRAVKRQVVADTGLTTLERARPRSGRSRLPARSTGTGPPTSLRLPGRVSLNENRRRLHQRRYQPSRGRFKADSQCAQSEYRATITSQSIHAVSGRDRSRSASREGFRGTTPWRVIGSTHAAIALQSPVSENFRPFFIARSRHETGLDD